MENIGVFTTNGTHLAGKWGYRHLVATRESALSAPCKQCIMLANLINYPPVTPRNPPWALRYNEHKTQLLFLKIKNLHDIAPHAPR